MVLRASNSTKKSLKGNSLARFPIIGVTVSNVTCDSPGDVDLKVLVQFSAV